jgi:hypothetical protein
LIGLQAQSAPLRQLLGLVFVATALTTLVSAQQSTSIIGPLAEIAAPPASHLFPNGQTYVYTVEWHLFTAGTATVHMEAASSDPKVTAGADSSGVANLLYAVHDRFAARFDPKTFCSLLVTKHTEEGAHKRDTQVRFDYERRKSVLNEKNLKTDESKQVENDIPHCVTDVITGFYYVASLPLQTGASYVFPVNDGGKTAEVTAHVEAREDVKVPAGTYHTIRVACEANSGPLKGKGKVWVWFTDDANRVPAQMRAKLTWGTLLFRLERIDR